MSRLILKVTGPEQSQLGNSAEMQFDENGGTVGRAQNNNWPLPDPACYLSSRHALITFQDGKFHITDLSSNGTYINGQDTPIGKNNTVCFDSISQLSMGPYTIQAEVQQPTPVQNDPFATSSQDGSLTAMFAPEQFESPAPAVQPTAPSSAKELSESPNDPADPLALLGGSSDVVPDFPEDWASEDSAIASSNVDQQDLIPNHQINDAFTPPQPTPNPAPGNIPDVPPENWDDTMFTPAALPENQNTNSVPQPAQAHDPFSVEPPVQQNVSVTPPETAGIPDDPDFFGASETSTATPDLEEETLIGLDTHNQDPFANVTPSNEVKPSETKHEQAPPVSQTVSEPTDLGLSTSNTTSEISSGEDSLVNLINQTPSPSLEPIEPEPVTQAPVEAHAVKVAPSSSQQESMNIAEATFRANGLDPELLNDPQFVDQAVALLPYFLNGTLDILQSRAQVKNELRASKTIFQAIDNNPLKFSVNLQDAVQNLFTHRRPGFLSPNDAVQEAFVDIGKHETALVAGIQGGLNGLLEKIKPETIEKRIEANESKKNLFGKISSSKKWDFYKETYSHITDNSGDSFLELFGTDFLNAYEAHINQKGKDGK